MILTLFKPKKFFIAPLDSRSSFLAEPLSKCLFFCAVALHSPRCKTGMRNRMKSLLNCL